MKLNLRKHIPTIRISSIKMPRFEWPKFNMPKPNISLIIARRLVILRAAIRALKPNITLPELKVPSVNIPRISLPNIKLPTFSRPTLAHFQLRPLNRKIANTLAVTSLSAIALILIFLTNNLNISPYIKEVTQFAVVEKKAFAFSQQNTTPPPPQFITTIEPAAGYDNEINITEPDTEELDDGYKYKIEESTLDVESVLIPHATTVISSSREGKIQSINFDNGQRFKKGDILVEYACNDARAEVEIAKTQEQLAQEKKTASYKLFKLDIISNIERLELETETKQAQARAALHKSRLQDCFIRAEYDGRVVKRLANPGEFTRTDRVLMEVASLDTLKIEFLLPSRWLRWVNIGAPIDVTIDETEQTYSAQISHIYGEVDPISQSIQITAQLDKYDDPLLPGMSGKTTIDINAIRKAGIIGFLETKPAE